MQPVAAVDAAGALLAEVELVEVFEAGVAEGGLVGGA